VLVFYVSGLCALRSSSGKCTSVPRARGRISSLDMGSFANYIIIALRGRGGVEEFVTVQTQNFSFFGKFVTRGEGGRKSRGFFLRDATCERPLKLTSRVLLCSASFFDFFLNFFFRPFFNEMTMNLIGE